MTLPNYISIFRLLLVPVFVVSLLDYSGKGTAISWWVAVIAYGMATVSDGIDGYIARRFRQRSELGAFLDPMADKLLLVSGLVVLSFPSDHLPVLPNWLVGTVFGRDLFCLLGFFVITHWCGRMKIQPHFVSKVATVLQMVVVGWGVLGRKDQFGLQTDLGAGVDGWLLGWCIAATAFTAASFFIYLPAGIKQLKTVPASAPAEDQSRRLTKIHFEVGSAGVDRAGGVEQGKKSEPKPEE